MTEMTDAEAASIDLAVVAYVVDGDWYVQDLPERSLESVETIAHELRRYPGQTGAIGMVAVDEDFSLLVRVLGGEVRLLLSDASAATDWTLAHSAVDALGVHVDLDSEAEPAGDVGILADLGLPAAEMGELLDDEDLYPDEVLGEVADRLGFGDAFDDLTADD